MRMMRKKNREISEDEALELLTQAEYGVLSTVDETGQPYGVPLNFCVVDGCIYFHCAVEGHKIDNMEQNSAVSFCAVGHTRVMPEKFSTKYESVIVTGVVEETLGAEKQKGLEGLVHKYSPEHVDKGLIYIKHEWDDTRVYKIVIRRVTGKARR